MEWLEHDSLLYYRGCIYVPDTSDLRRRIVSLCHNTKVAGHQGCFKTLELASWSYWWPNMSRYIGMYVSHCNLCLHTKIQCHLPTGELQLLPIPEERWGVISVDFISDRRNGSTRNWNNTCGSSSEKDRMTGTHSSLWRSFHHIHSSTQQTPFLLDTGQHPRMGFELHQPPSRVEAVNECMDRMKDTLKEAKLALAKAKDNMAQYYNRRRSPAPSFSPGDMVYLDSEDIQTICPLKKLSHRRLGPYPVERRVRKYAYHLTLPPPMRRLHLVFNVVKLSPAPDDPIVGTHHCCRSS